MNKNQKIVIVVMATVILLMLLFPPLHLVLAVRTFNAGYGFILSSQEFGATVNIGMLLVQWLGVIVLGSLAFFFLKGSGTNSPKNQKKEEVHDTVPPLQPEAPCGQDIKFLGGRYHPWRRFFARTVDILYFNLIFSFIVGYLVGRFFPEKIYLLERSDEHLILTGMFMYVVWAPVEAIFLTYMGSTPAKLLFGICILSKTGEKLLYSDALQRSFLVWGQGEGLGIPFITPFTRWIAYRKLLKTGTTRWDSEAGSVVTHRKWGVIRAAVCVMSVVAIILIYSMLNAP